MKVNKKALRRSFWASLGRLTGVMLGAGAGSLLYQAVGSDGSIAIGLATCLAVGAFFLIWFSEYERESVE